MNMIVNKFLFSEGFKGIGTVVVENIWVAGANLGIIFGERYYQGVWVIWNDPLPSEREVRGPSTEGFCELDSWQSFLSQFQYLKIIMKSSNR